jgi:outer membrane protein OmpA-like peptidoglycan-associated protein
MTGRFIVGAVVGWVAISVGSLARGDGFDGQRFTPAAGAAGGFVVERPLVLHHLGFGAGLFLHFADDTVVLRDVATGADLATPVDSALTLDLVASLGLLDIFELALVIPIDLVYSGDPAETTTGQVFAAKAGFGDIRVVPKALFWEGGSTALHASIGAAIPVTFPSGDPRALRGSDGLTVEPRLLVAFGGPRWQVVGNTGVLLRSSERIGDLNLGSSWTYGLAGTVRLTPLVDLQAELVGAVVPSTERPNHTEAPAEIIAGVILHPAAPWSVYAGGAIGLDNALGTADFRIIGGVRYAIGLPDERRFEDDDHDGIINRNDRCPNEPEDFDGFQDDDGCPDPDNDGDGILDEVDECPDVRGDPPDGCPRGRVIVRKGKVEVIGKVLFKIGSAEVQPKSEPLLDDIARALKDHPELQHIRIEGNTDNVGDPSFNERLSEARADSVKKALVARGVPANRLDTKGLGDAHAISSNSTATGRARNRRVEFVVVQ